MADLNKQDEFLMHLDPVVDRIARYARALCGNKENAKDLVSESILIAYENFEKIKDKKAFLSYVFTIINRLFKRQLKLKKYYGLYDTEMAEQIPSGNVSPDSLLDVEILYKKLKKLPDKQREAIILFEISGFRIDEIKDIQGGTISGVKSRLKRARKKLEELLADSYSKQSIKNNNHNTNNGKVKEFEDIRNNHPIFKSEF